MSCPLPPRFYDHHDVERRWRPDWLWVSRSMPAALITTNPGDIHAAIAQDVLLRHRIMRGISVSAQSLRSPNPNVQPTERESRRPHLSLLGSPSGQHLRMDPHELAIQESFGTDTVRFAAAMQAKWPPGPECLKGAAALANKFWHCLRFACIHLKGDEPLSPDMVRASDLDRWFMQRLNTATAQLNDHFERNQLAWSCARLQRLIRHDLSGWYLESSRRYLDNPQSRQCVRYAMLHVAHLLHPLMPNITQETFAKLGSHPGRLLIQHAYPEFRSEFVFSQAARRVDTLHELVREIRRIMGIHFIPDHGQVTVVLTGGSDSDRRWINAHGEDIVHLAGINQLHLAGLPPTGAFTGTAGAWSVHIPIADPRIRASILVDLRREQDELNRRIHRMQHKLGDRDFAKAVAPDTLRRWKQRLQQELRNRERIIRTLGWLSDPNNRAGSER